MDSEIEIERVNQTVNQQNLSTIWLTIKLNISHALISRKVYQIQKQQMNCTEWPFCGFRFADGGHFDCQI